MLKTARALGGNFSEYAVHHLLTHTREVGQRCDLGAGVNTTLSIVGMPGHGWSRCGGSASGYLALVLGRSTYEATPLERDRFPKFMFQCFMWRKLLQEGKEAG